jgi:hypothetical protein
LAEAGVDPLTAATSSISVAVTILLDASHSPVQVAELFRDQADVIEQSGGLKDIYGGGRKQ